MFNNSNYILDQIYNGLNAIRFQRSSLQSKSHNAERLPILSALDRRRKCKCWNAFFPQVWFKNRRAKFRKGQRFPPLPKRPALGDTKRAELSEDERSTKNGPPLSDVSASRAASTIAGDPARFQTPCRLTSPSSLVYRDQHKHPGLLSTALPFSASFFPFMQPHGSTADVMPMQKSSSLGLHINSMALPCLDL